AISKASNGSVILITGKGRETRQKRGTKYIDVPSDVEIVEELIKGINNGGNINILPNMEINTFEVVANHFVTIGNIRESDLFYLKSKGIAEFVAKELILSGFLKSIFGGEEINE
ncbi:MAG: SufD family Fe-S cluster assembly protein, partial [Bacilli bacterium]